MHLHTSRTSGATISTSYGLAVVAFLCSLLHTCSVPALAWQASAADATGAPSFPLRRAFPRISLSSGLQLKFDGMISADGKFESRIGRFLKHRGKGTTATPGGEGDSFGDQGAFRAAAPPNLLVNRKEQTVEDFQPPAHAVEAPKERSIMRRVAESIVSVSYGANPILDRPEQVTTDSRRRVVLTDAGSCTVHVLSRKANESFQIVGGPGRRFGCPRSVAIDSADNIYVSDSARGQILVYDSTGEFVRDLGNYGDEALFARPAGIAIDRAAGHLYVADPPRHTVYILDLTGHMVGRIPSRQADATAIAGSAQPGKFRYPQSVLVQDGMVVVLDSRRIQSFDVGGKFLSAFEISNNIDWRGAPLRGLFMDASGHIYLSDSQDDIVREYDRSGHQVGTFGRPGLEAGEFNVPKGMWVDGSGRLYIVDRHRVQVFRIVGH